MKDDGLIYDWNTAGDFFFPAVGRVTLDDETLRDGLQNPSVHNPSIEEKIEILHLMESLGIESANIGLPAAGPRAYADAEALALEISGARLKIRPNCAARTVEEDIRQVAEISQRAGIAIEVGTFIGSSAVRRLVEGWSVDFLVRTTEKAVRFGVAQGLPVMYVTEDTTRTDAETVQSLYGAAIRCGAQAVVLCDTVGHATPMGAYNLVKFVREKVVVQSGAPVRVDWHGHCDRGLALANSFAAIAAGADQVQCAANSLGERVGNTPTELMLVNMQLLGMIDRDLSKLRQFSETVARATHTAIPPNSPVVGRDAFRTATGVHAAALIKAQKMGDVRLADLVYSGVPASRFGAEQIIEVGPMSGKSNVVHWMERHGISPGEELIKRILDAAKGSSTVLTDEELFSLCRQPSAR
jgi:isopropylmalate/homocitrate/citramalate synthase